MAFVIRKPGTRFQATLAGAALLGAFALASAAGATTTQTTTAAAKTSPVGTVAKPAQPDTPVAAAAAAVAAMAAPAAPAPAAPAPVAPAPAALTAPAGEVMHPVAVGAPQDMFTPDTEQLRNAKAIIDAGKKMNLPPRAWVIAIATSLQESNLKNLGDLGANNDHDSLGLFQQRPSSGWGTPAQIEDPQYAATAFYKGLIQVPGWDHMGLTDAAQKVQVSAYPDHYAKHEVEAGDIVRAIYGEGPYGAIGKSLG